MKSTYDAIVLGAGAAGLMAAIEAGKRGRRVLVLEHSDQAGKKILISGGGRCNFTNVHAGPENFLSSNPHFAKSPLARYTPADFIKLVEKHRIRYHEKKLGQLFCDGSAREIVTMLESDCRETGRIDILTGASVSNVEKAGEFLLTTAATTYRAAKLVVATGGLSIPKIGATSFGYDLARKFGLKIVPTRPALVPFVFSRDDQAKWCDLAGTSADVLVSTSSSRQKFREKLLFTHRGLSGPAILQISSYWKTGDSLSIDLAPDHDLRTEASALNVRSEKHWKAFLREILTKRLADRWLEIYPLQGTSDRAFVEAEIQLHQLKVAPQTTEGYAKAEVTAGGIDTDELSAKTMESRTVPGLYFVGEVVDVTGQLGGFNFQWAWASGFCAGQAL